MKQIKISAEVLTRKAQEVSIPDHMIEGLVQYVLIGRPVGHFLTAILSNDLKEACLRADETNQSKLFNYVFFLYNYCPQGCWGSLENVKEWITNRGITHFEKTTT